MLNKDFILAGKAIFTIEIPQEFQNKHGTKPHYTYKVKYKPADLDFPETWFISILTKSDSYSYLGILAPDNGEVIITKSSKYNVQTWPVVILRRFLARVWQNEEHLVTWNVHHEGRCCRCGKRLTVPESVKSGWGPECIKYIGK